MQYSFILDSLAVSVYYLKNPYVPDEAGARVDIHPTHWRDWSHAENPKGW